MGTQHADRQGRGTEYVKKDSIKIKILRFDTINSGKKCTFTRMSERTLIIYKECINNIIERLRTRSNSGTKRMMIRVSNIFKAEIKINEKKRKEKRWINKTGFHSIQLYEPATGIDISPNDRSIWQPCIFPYKRTYKMKYML